MRGVLTVREHDKLKIGPSLTKEDVADLEAIARKVLKHKDGDLAAGNHVGVITTGRGMVVEILPKIDLGGEADPDDEKTRQTFLRMLRCWRGLSEALPESGINAMPRFPTRVNPARSLPCTDAAAPPIRKSLMKYGVPGILGKGAEMGGQDSVNPPRAGSLDHREPEVTRTRSRRRLGRACSGKPDGRAEPARCRGASLPCM